MASFHSKIIVFLTVFALLGTSLLGCGDAKVSGNVDQSRNADDETAPSIGDKFFMVPAGETHLVGNVTESVGLKIFLYDKKSGEPAVNQIVSYEILDPAGTGVDEDAPEQEEQAQEGDGEAEDSDLASLSAFNGTTNEEGAATIDLRLGAHPGTVRVRASHDLSNAVEFDVNIEALETGDLEITLVNSSPSVMRLNNIKVRLYRNADLSCAQFHPFQSPNIDELDSRTAATTSVKPTFESLGTRQRFMVTALAEGDAGQVVSAGCAEDLVIDADQVTEREVLLQLIPLNPVGRYDVTSNWDFSQALADSGSVGSTIVTVLNIFDNPGQGIYDGIIDLIRNFVSGVVGGGLDLFLDLTGLDDVLVDAINNAVENNDALRRIRDAGRDLRDVVANLEVHSELTIGKMSSDYEFRGTDNWLGVTLYWRWNCDDNAPADCGAINIAADGDGDLGSLGVLSSQWTGRVIAYNSLQIDRHALSLRYGQLIQYILNEVIIPEITNGEAHSLSEAFTGWVCGGLVSSIADSNGEICAPSPFDGSCFDAAGACDSAVSTVFGLSDLLISGLEYDVGLSIAGEATLVETTSDGVVDELADGVFEGTMRNAGDAGQSAQSSEISATWDGVRAVPIGSGL